MRAAHLPKASYGHVRAVTESQPWVRPVDAEEKNVEMWRALGVDLPAEESSGETATNTFRTGSPHLLNMLTAEALESSGPH